MQSLTHDGRQAWAAALPVHRPDLPPAPAADPRVQALWALVAAERRVGHDPATLAAARLATAAAIAGDERVITAAVGGDLQAAQEAAAEWQQQREETCKQRRREWRHARPRLLQPAPLP
jgi:hypothetical protein